MADPNVLAAWGFEGTWADLARNGWVRSGSGSVTVSTSYPNNSGGYGGERALALSHTAVLDQTATTPAIAGTPYAADFSSYCEGDGPSSNMYITFRLGTTDQMTVGILFTGDLTVRRGGDSGTLLTTVAGAVSPVSDSRHRIQVTLLADNAGTIEVWIDGVSVYSFAGDTQAGASPGWDRILFNHDIANTRTWHIDDLIITDSANGGLFTSEQRAWRRDVTTQTSSSFSGHDDGAAGIADNDLATYSEALVPGEKQQYAAAGLPFTPVRVTSQILHTAAFERDGTITGLTPIVVSEGVEYPAATVVGIGVGSYVAAQSIFQVDPNTGAEWTAEGVSASEIAYEAVG